MEQEWSLEEAVAYYRRQGAPGSQQALVALLREVQEHRGGVIPAGDLAAAAEALGVKDTFLRAVAKRYPSLRTEDAPHRLELCGGRSCGGRGNGELARWVEETYQVTSGGVSAAGGFSYRCAGCMKHCGKGPNLKWDGQVYHGADRELIKELVEKGSRSDRK